MQGPAYHCRALSARGHDRVCGKRTFAPVIDHSHVFGAVTSNAQHRTCTIAAGGRSASVCDPILNTACTMPWGCRARGCSLEKSCIEDTDGDGVCAKPDLHHIDSGTIRIVCRCILFAATIVGV